MSDGSKKAVKTAVFGNGVVAISKFVGFIFSGSSALLAEAIHSLADTMNQSLLWLGIVRSEKEADKSHHFGYGQERYFWNMVSAVTIFFIGCLYTVNHAYHQLLAEEPYSESGNMLVGMSIIVFAILVEGYSFLVALGEFNSQRKKVGVGFIKYLRDTRDPTTLAVLVEDSVAVLGLFLAALGMGLTWYTGSAVFDGVAAMLIGLLMGFLAVFLGLSNKKYLINLSDVELDEKARAQWELDDRIQAVHKIQSIVLGPQTSMLTAEIELCEEALFKDMTKEEIDRAIVFMKKLTDIKDEFERNVKTGSKQAEHIVLEYVLPSNKS